MQEPALPTLRRADESDLVGVVGCLAETFEPFRSSYTQAAFQDTVLSLEAARRRLTEMTILVAVDETGRVVGSVAWQVRARGEGHVRGMAVVPRFQGGGLAHRLLQSAEHELRSLGCTRVTLDTTLPLQRAIRFYTAQGYQPTGMVSDFFGMPLHEYEKPLLKGTG